MGNLVDDIQHQWFVVQVLSGQEKKAKKNVEENRDTQNMSEAISEVLLPVENVSEVKNGKQTVRESAYGQAIFL